MSTRNVRYLAACTVVAAGLATTASGQNALGDGRALQNPLQTIHQGTAPPIRTSFSDELRFREAVVYGTAPSGLAFRGESLPSRFEFRGELGEDDLFAFRRDSLYSGLAGRGIRGTDALQYQFALTTGGQVPRNMAGQLSYARAGQAERGDDPGQPFMRDLTQPGQGPHLVPEETDDSLLSAVQAGPSLVQPVRSISAYTANRNFQPNLIGVMQNRVTQEAAGQTASPLMGVQTVPIDQLRDPMQEPFKLDTPTEAVPPPTLNPIRAPTAYDDLITRFSELTAPPAGSTVTPGAAPESEAGQIPLWAKDILAIRAILQGVPEETQVALGIKADPREEPDQIVGPRAEDPANAPLFSNEVLQRIREAGGMTTTLIPTDQPQIDRYGAYMEGAQDLLARERYFDAEERFISAMTARPGDINASIGRVHSQLGAGLFLSAGLNLRQILVVHPEVAGMRYGAGLLPAPARIAEVKDLLRDSLASPSAGADSGLLLAYLGFQTGDGDAIVEGLDAMAKHADEADARLAVMLRGVWLGTDAPAEEAPAEESPASPAEGG